MLSYSTAAAKKQLFWEEAEKGKWNKKIKKLLISHTCSQLNINDNCNNTSFQKKNM